MLWFKAKQSGPPDAAQVASRARILAARIVHAMAWPPPDALADLMANWSDDDRRDFVEKYDAASQAMRASLQSTGLWEQTTPDEQTFFSAAFTERTMQQCVDSSWAVESVACCLWALGVLPQLPPYDTEASIDVCKQVPKPSEPLNLRPAAELESTRATAQTWHWRSRTRQIADSGQPLPPLPNNLSLDDIVRVSAQAAFEQGEIPDPIDGDFPACGKAYRHLSPEEYQHVASIAVERHKALNWVCGLAPKNRWYLTPTDT